MFAFDLSFCSENTLFVIFPIIVNKIGEGKGSNFVLYNAKRVLAFFAARRYARAV